MQSRSIGVLFSILLLFVAGAAAQTAEQSGLIKTANGYLIVSNEPGNLYTMEIKGNLIKPVPDHPYWFYIDGKFFQIVSALESQFLKNPADKRLDEKEILSTHQVWESDYIAETLGSKLKVASVWLKLTDGTTALSWSYDMPHVSDKQTAKRQLYLIVLKGDRVFGVNTVVEKDGEEKGLQQLLIDTMNTLKPSDKPLSLEKARELVLKGTRP